MVRVLLADTFVVCDVLGKSSRLFDLSEEKISKRLLSVGSQRRHSITLKVIENEVPLMQEIKHPIITVPRQVREVIKAIHLAHVIFGFEVVIDHPCHLQAGDGGIFLSCLIFFTPNALM